MDGKSVDISQARPKIAMPKHSINLDEQDAIYFSELFMSMAGQKAYEGGRHAALFRLAAVGCKAEMDDEFLAESLERWNTKKCYPPLSCVDINKAVRCARRKIMEG